MKKLLLSLSALLLLAALVFTGIYFTRFQSMATLQKITDYSDGYNLYRMDIRYRYSLNDLLARGITDDQSMVDAILEEALPLLPVMVSLSPSREMRSELLLSTAHLTVPLAPLMASVHTSPLLALISNIPVSPVAASSPV